MPHYSGVDAHAQSRTFAGAAVDGQNHLQLTHSYCRMGGHTMRISTSAGLMLLMALICRFQLSKGLSNARHTATEDPKGMFS